MTTKPSQDFANFKPEYSCTTDSVQRHARRLLTNDAYIWQEGNRGKPYAEMFFIVDQQGREVTIQDQKHRPGHAYAILEKLDRKT